MWPRRVQNPFFTTIVMLHIKTKVMKREIQWCKKCARGHVWGSPEVKKQDIGSFFYCHTNPSRIFELEP